MIDNKNYNKNEDRKQNKQSWACFIRKKGGKWKD